MNPPELVKDDRVELKYGGRTYVGTVFIASPNHVSIGVYLDDGIAWPTRGPGVHGCIPYMWDGECYRDLIFHEKTEVKKL